MSVVEIKSKRTLDENRRIVDNGLYDLRMGPMSRHSQTCRTCGGNIDECPGHFGHIELAEPIYHPFCDSIIIKILNCICNNCGRLLLDPEDPKNANKWNELLKIRDASERISLLQSMSESIEKCEGTTDPIITGNILELEADDNGYKKKGCNACRLDVIKDTNSKSILVIKRLRNKAKAGDYEILSCKKVLDILSLVRDEDVAKMGLDPVYSHPRNFILTRLPIIPTIARSSVQTDAVNSAPDDLTSLIAHIVDCNNEIRDTQRNKVLATKANEENIDRLRKLIKVYIDNSDSKLIIRDKQGRQLKGINQQIKSKTGLIRLNLMGKRLDFTARTVISGDPTISIEQVGVPESVAKTMTYEETVTDFNIEELTRMVQNGDTWPGAKSITLVDGTKISLAVARNNPNGPDVLSLIKKGAKVERHMKDGDFVLFNRQPTLHKVSIMGHRVKVMKYSTFRLNLSVTTPYNADFDGDEMNLHLPQGHAARSEIKNLMLVPENVVVSQMNAPIIGIVQDSLLACYLMTRRNVFIERRDVMNFMMWLDEWDGKLAEPAIMYPKKLWTGKQIFSAIIPDAINLEGFHPTHNSNDRSFNPIDDTHVYIRKGQLHMGMLSGAQLGSGKRGIIHIIWLDLGPNSTKSFINGIQRITMNWLLLNGFSVGIGDMVPSQEVKVQVRNIISNAIKETNNLFTQACQGNIKRAPGQTPLDAFEVNVQKMLGETGSKNGKIIKDTIHSLNNIRSMVISGSKGSDLNLAQIIGCLGQQSLMGGRIPFKFLSHRALPHFPAYDYSASAKGYVQNSYLLGLNPTEFFFHAIGGREGVIDTAVKTADIGYTYQKMVKSLEDIIIEYDGTARRGEGEVVQLLFGDDGIDSIYMEMESLDWILLPDKDYESRYRLQVLDVEKSVKSVDISAENRNNINYDDPLNLLSHLNGTGEEMDTESEKNGDLYDAFGDNSDKNNNDNNLSNSSNFVSSEDQLYWENKKDFTLFEDTSYKFAKGLGIEREVLMDKLEGKNIIEDFGENWLDSSIISELKSSQYEQMIVERYYQKLYKMREDFRESIKNGSQSIVLGNIYDDNTTAIPMSIKRILNTAEINNKILPTTICKLNPSECVRKVLWLVNKITEIGMKNYNGGSSYRRHQRIKNEDENNDNIDDNEDNHNEDNNDIDTRENKSYEDNDNIEDGFNSSDDSDPIERLNKHNKQYYEDESVKPEYKKEKQHNSEKGEYMDNSDFNSTSDNDNGGYNYGEDDDDDDDDNTDFITDPIKKEKYEKKKLRNFRRIYKCKPNDINRPTTMFTMHIMHLLSPKQLCYTRRFNYNALEDVINTILKKYTKSQISPGEAVGIVAAESIAQPMTQMTLNTFHSAGVANATVTQGLPRLKEIMGAVQKIKTPSCTLRVKNHMPVERSMVSMNKDREREIHFKQDTGMYYSTGIKISGNNINNDGTMDPKNQAIYIQGSLAYTTVNSVEHRRIVIYDPWECNEENKRYVKYMNELEEIITKKMFKKQRLSDKQLAYFEDLKSVFEYDSRIISLATNTGDDLYNEIFRDGIRPKYYDGGNDYSFKDSDSELDGVDHDDAYESQSMSSSYSHLGLTSFASPWVIRFELNKQKMLGKGFRVMDIKKAIERYAKEQQSKGFAKLDKNKNAFGKIMSSGDLSISSVWSYIDLYIQTSTDNSDNLVIRIRPILSHQYVKKALESGFPDSIKKAYELMESDSEDFSKYENYDSLNLKDVPFHFDIPFLKILKLKSGAYKRFLHEATDHPTVLLAKEISNIYVCGIPDITAAYYRDNGVFTVNEKTNAISKETQWFIDTEGATKDSFLYLMRLWGVDWTKTMCNDPNIICQTLGIEAARTLILNELKTVMSAASYVNGRHLKLIAEIMTAAGKLLSVDRNGMFKRENLVLLKCSFEKPLVTLLNAGFYSQMDKLCGMTEALMTGNVVPVGTGRVSTLLNMDAENLGGVDKEDSEQMDNGDAIPDGTTYREGSYEATPTVPLNSNWKNDRLMANPDVTPGTVASIVNYSKNFELSPERASATSRQLSETRYTGLTGYSMTAETISMRATNSSAYLSGRTPSLISKNSSAFISSRTNISQVSGSKKAEDTTASNPSPSNSTGPSPNYLFTDDYSPYNKLDNEESDATHENSDGSQDINDLF